MADVQPLQGIRYVPEAIGDLAEVVTPPFDVISAEAQARYYARSPYNSIRLELGQIFPDDTTLNNRYTRAAKTLAEWRMQGILRQDTTPGYYLYQQTFAHDGNSYTRTGLIARVRLAAWSERVVLPHEHTLSKPKDDRLKLMRACATNFSPVMSLYDDPQGRMRRLLSAYASQAEVHVIDEAQEEHRLHPITDEKQIALIHDFFAERQLYIADGHHRYETALNYREEVREQRRHLEPGDAANFVMMTLIDVDDPGLLVLPTHRLLFDLDKQALQALSAEHLARYFTVRELDTTENNEALLQQLAQAGERAPAFIVTTAERVWLLSLNEQGAARMAESEHSSAWNTLDVALVQRLVLEELLGLSTADITAGPYTRYTHATQEALQAIAQGQAQVVILLNATPIRQVCDVAQADDRMPQKSTYLYPKLLTGLVMNPLW
ncbi:MAG: DUF1015 domain-containing protein [Ktedonobacteraceae bacterium]